MATFLRFYIVTFFYFFIFQNIFSLILGSVSTILLSWLNSRNKMLACSVSVTWLFWLKGSSHGFALYFQDAVRGGTLVYGVFIQNLYTACFLYFGYYLDRNSIRVDTAAFSPFLHFVIEKDIWWNKYCLLVNSFLKMICYRILLQSLTESLLAVSSERFSNQ